MDEHRECAEIMYELAFDQLLEHLDFILINLCLSKKCIIVVQALVSVDDSIMYLRFRVEASVDALCVLCFLEYRIYVEVNVALII